VLFFVFRIIISRYSWPVSVLLSQNVSNHFFIVIGINTVDLLLMYLLSMQTYSSFGQTRFFIALAVLTGLLGNFFYFKDSVKNIKNNTVYSDITEQELV